MTWNRTTLLSMLVVGAVVQVISYWVLHHWYSVPQSRGFAIWLMLISWWPFLRMHPMNKNVHVGFYVAAALVVSTCAVFLAYYL
jgi:hypothetical protein